MKYKIWKVILPLQDNIVLNQLHFIIPLLFEGYSGYPMKQGIQKALKKFGCTSAILSTIAMHREHCITKERYDELYKANEESERKDLSVGEDLETFIGRIKNGEINKDTIRKFGDRRPHNEMFISTRRKFLLCLLDKEERKKLEQEDRDFMRTFKDGYHKGGRGADVPEAEWKRSESNMKFAKSYSFRDTYFIDA